jgi:NTP pyrophosphatase (non-canonical NTP hydrolase)
MTLDELFEKIDEIDELVVKKFGVVDKEKRMLVELVKIQEELGELCSESLTQINLQLKEKVENFKGEHLEDEFIDVFVNLLLLGKLMDIDLEKSLERKLKVIKERLKEG